MFEFRKFTAGAVTAAAVALVSFSASAGGSFKDGYVAPSFSWTGVYVGAQIGYQWGEATHKYSNGAPSDDAEPEGGVYGGHIGVNGQSENVVYGVEADLEYSDVYGSSRNPIGLTSSSSTDIDWQGSIRARLGVAFDRSLFYVTGGWAFGEFDVRGGPIGNRCCGYKEIRNGWTLGAGGEYAFTNNITARLEYRYTDFGQTSGFLNPAFPAVRMQVDPYIHTVRAGVSYKF